MDKAKAKLAGMLKSKVTQLYAAVQEATCPAEQQPQHTYAPPVVLQEQPAAPPPPHFIIQCSCHHVSPIPDPSFGGFKHPGTLMGPAEMNLLRQRTAGAVPTPPPFQAALASLQANTPAQYTPHALRDMLIEWYDGPKIGHDELVKHDARMVYMQALMWVVSGQECYAKNAVSILRTWATTNKTLQGRNAPLEAAWSMASFARSAELLKYSYPGWDAAGVEGPFLQWVDRVMMPALTHESLQRLPLANWHTSVAEAKGALAILTGNRDLWSDACALWVQVAQVYLKSSCGECGETSRDLYHTQYGLGGLIQMAELAWHQGQDLYSWNNSRLFTCMEFHAYITLGGKPPECDYPLKGIGFLPCGWEVGYNHYVGRMGYQMPQTAALLETSRPEGYEFHWGLGSLTHANAAAALQPPQQQVF